jgi:DNA-binding transcriptional LysR family regulator
MMKFRHLRYFVAVAEELNFTRAAERLNMAQPPLSQQIKQLEDDLGTILIERASRPMRLTRAGAVMLGHARQILDMSTAAKADVMRIGKGQTGLLNVAFVGSALYSVLPGILSHFRREYPRVDVSLNEMLAPDIASGLEDRKVDVGIVRPALVDVGELEQRPLVEEQMVLAVPDHHPLARKDCVSLACVHCEPLILYPIHPKPSLTEEVLKSCKALGAEPDIIQEVLHLQTALILVAQGVGLTLVVQSVARQPRTGVVFVSIADPAPTSVLSVAWRKGVASPSLDNFLRICDERSRRYAK